MIRMAKEIKMRCVNLQNDAETVFYFYPEKELVTNASTSAFKVGVKKLLREYNKRLNAGESVDEFSVFDEWENEYIFQTLKVRVMRI